MEKASEANLPFLDCIISLNEKREKITTGYRKPAHAGQYTYFYQFNGYPLNVINKTVKDTLQSHNSEHKSIKLEPLKMFIPYEKSVAEKLKRVASKYGFATVFTKTKDLGGQLRTKQKDKMETSGVVYEVDCNNCFKKYTSETGRELKERMKEHKDDGEKF